MQLNDVFKKQNEFYDNKDEVVDEDIILLRFALNNNYFALPIDKAREVITGGDIAYTPESHPYILGVLNLRGNLIPILKPESFVEHHDQNLAHYDPSELTTLVLEEDGLTFGILVEQVKKIITPDHEHVTQLKENHIMNIMDAPCLYLDMQTILQKVR